MSDSDLISEFYASALWPGNVAAGGSGDAVSPRATVKEWRLDKYDGDPPQPGEHKLPIEYITGGDELPTRRFVLDPATSTYREETASNGSN